MAAHSRGVLVAVPRDARPQLSTVDYCLDPPTRGPRRSVTDGRAEVTTCAATPGRAATPPMPAADPAYGWLP